MHDLQLVPFLPTPIASELLARVSVTCRCTLVENALQLHYHLIGAHAVALTPRGTPQRKHGLWEDTCFELFFAPKGETRYWEVNLSPSGDWNVYHFDAYRAGMKEDLSISTIQVQTSSPKAGEFDLEAALGLPADLRSLSLLKDFEISVATVVKFNSGELAYFAIKHPSKDRPDFHDRKGFICL